MISPDKMSKCSLSAFTNDDCGGSIHHPLEIDTVELKTCDRAIGSHLRALGVSDSSKSVKEGELIAYRVGFFVFPSDYRVCPRHRDILGLHWQALASCQYPYHVGKAKPYRSISICMSRRMLIEKGVLLPVGSGICRKCHEDYLKLIKENESTTMTSVDDMKPPDHKNSLLLHLLCE